MSGELTVVDPSEETVAVPSSALAILQKAEIDIAISTARAFPRSIKLATGKATSLATLDQQVAASCFYTLPRGNKKLTGPSIRLAEIMAISWGNLRYGARIVAEDQSFLVAQGVAHDLETNVSATMEVRRRITKSNGQRYNEDMITVTANAACAIALRNAIFKIIPFAVVRPVFEEARKTATGDISTLLERRDKALLFFKDLGVPLPNLLHVINRQRPEDIDLNDLLTLRGLMTAINDGDTTVEEAFPSPAKADEPPAGPPTGRVDLRRNGNGHQAAQQPQASTPPTPLAAPEPEPVPLTKTDGEIIDEAQSQAPPAELDQDEMQRKDIYDHLVVEISRLESPGEKDVVLAEINKYAEYLGQQPTKELLAKLKAKGQELAKRK